MKKKKLKKFILKILNYLKLGILCIVNFFFGLFDRSSLSQDKGEIKVKNRKEKKFQKKILPTEFYDEEPLTLSTYDTPYFTIEENFLFSHVIKAYSKMLGLKEKQLDEKEERELKKWSNEMLPSIRYEVAKNKLNDEENIKLYLEKTLKEKLENIQNGKTSIDFTIKYPTVTNSLSIKQDNKMETTKLVEKEKINDKENTIILQKYNEMEKIHDNEINNCEKNVKQIPNSFEAEKNIVINENIYINEDIPYFNEKENGDMKIESIATYEKENGGMKIESIATYEKNNENANIDDLIINEIKNEKVVMEDLLTNEINNQKALDKTDTKSKEEINNNDKEKIKINFDYLENKISEINLEAKVEMKREE